MKRIALWFSGFVFVFQQVGPAADPRPAVNDPVNQENPIVNPGYRHGRLPGASRAKRDSTAQVAFSMSIAIFLIDRYKPTRDAFHDPSPDRKNCPQSFR